MLRAMRSITNFTFKPDAEVPVGDINLDRWGLLTGGYVEENVA